MSATLDHDEQVLRWRKTYQEQLQQQHQQKQHAFEPRWLAWPGWSCWAGAVPPAADSCCTDICLFRISIRSDPMGYRQRRDTEFSILKCQNQDYIFCQEDLLTCNAPQTGSARCAVMRPKAMVESWQRVHFCQHFHYRSNLLQTINQIPLIYQLTPM